MPIAKKSPPRPLRRQIFVFTDGEKKGAACVLIAVVLGLGAQRYRQLHPRPAPPLTAKAEYAARKATRASAARARSARAQKTSAAVAAAATPAEDTDD